MMGSGGMSGQPNHACGPAPDTPKWTAGLMTSADNHEHFFNSIGHLPPPPLAPAISFQARRKPISEGVVFALVKQPLAATPKLIRPYPFPAAAGAAVGVYAGTLSKSGTVPRLQAAKRALSSGRDTRSDFRPPARRCWISNPKLLDGVLDCGRIIRSVHISYKLRRRAAYSGNPPMIHLF
jgi:hypothetical protein